MKRKFMFFLTFLLTIFMVSSGESIKATENDPAYMITDDYVIIDHVRYELNENKIHYMGLDFELKDGTLIAHDAEGVESIMVLPVKENRITDKETIAKLNAMVGVSDSKTRAIPSNTVNLDYKKN